MAMRKCLGCGEMFDSTGPGNRKCPKCKPNGTSHGRTAKAKHTRPVNNKSCSI